MRCLEHPADCHYIQAMGFWGSNVFAILLFINLQFWSAPSSASTVEKVQTIFTQSVQDSSFNTSYLYNGCYIRAHALALNLNQYQISSFKIFLSDLNETKIHFPHPDLRRRPARWAYHVVAAVEIEKTVYVLDPTLSQNILELSHWLKLYKEIPENVNLNFVFKKVSVHQLTPEAEFNLEFLNLGDPFSKHSEEYIDFEMENLFFYEQADLQENLLL